MAGLLEVNEQNFEVEVLKENKLTVVDFWAPWCGYCVKLSPMLEEIANEIPDAKFVKMNTDECMNVAKDYSISGLPCILLFQNGKPIDRFAGAMPKANIISGIKKYL